MRDATGTGDSGYEWRRLLVVLTLLAVVALAGCSLLAGGDGGGEELPSGEEAANQYRSLDGYEATLHYEYSDRPDRRSQIQADVNDGRFRVEWRAPDSLVGNVNVYNGTTLVRYNATDHEYVSIATEDIEPFTDGAERIETAVDDAREEGETTVEGPPAGGAPLPAVPSGDGGTAESETATDSRFEVSYEGTETVAGRQAHVIDYEPVGDPGEGVVEQTVWLDTEHFLTLKSTQVTRRDGTESTFTFRMTDLDLEPGLSADTFEFDPPAGATPNESNSYDLTSYETRADLAAAVDTSVPEPSVSDRLQLDRADHIRGADFSAVQLRYRSTGTFIFVTKTTEQGYTNLSEGERVQVGDQSGRYRASGQRALVAWQCDGYVYTVTADISMTELLDVARSVECA